MKSKVEPRATMIVAITGGMGSGKSCVSGLLAKLLHADVMDADILCRQFLQRDKQGWQGVYEHFGARFFDGEGDIDRPALRQALFADASVRQEIEHILHPLVRQEICSKAERARAAQGRLVVEVPLLFEVGWQSDFDWVVVIYAGRECCVRRVAKRDKVSLLESRAAVAAQMSLADKVLQADSVIDNSGPLALTCLQVCHLASVLR